MAMMRFEALLEALRIQKGWTEEKLRMFESQCVKKGLVSKGLIDPNQALIIRRAFEAELKTHTEALQP
jgi:hypothetical protein